MIEWRDDDHVMLTGPAECEFSGSFDPSTGAWARDTEARPDAALSTVRPVEDR